MPLSDLLSIRGWFIMHALFCRSFSLSCCCYCESVRILYTRITAIWRPESLWRGEEKFQFSKRAFRLKSRSRSLNRVATKTGKIPEIEFISSAFFCSFSDKMWEEFKYQWIDLDLRRSFIRLCAFSSDIITFFFWFLLFLSPLFLFPTPFSSRAFSLPENWLRHSTFRSHYH